MQHSGLGMVANGKRSIRSGSQYNRFFNLGSLESDEVQLMEGTVMDTVGLMKKIVAQYNGQTKSIAQQLKGPNREATARNIWNFLYNHVQYTKDHPTREQLRTPLRTWADRKRGVDCDCYSIFISSVLTNLGIPHAFRIAKYEGDWQHVYVVVPKQGTNYSSYYTIDPVVDRFDYEVAPTDKKDYTMKVTMLNGIGACPTNSEKAEQSRPINFVSTDQLVKNNLFAADEVLRELNIPFATVVNDANNPTVMASTANGDIELPTIITEAQVEQLKATTENNNDALEASVKTTPTGESLAIGAAIIAGITWLFSSNTKGLSGPPKKRARKKLATLNI